jgi:hypothetical protein
MAEKHRAAEQAAEVRRRQSEINRERARIQENKTKRLSNRPKPRV